MKKLENHLLNETIEAREDGTLKDIDGFIEFLEDEIKTYSSWKNALQHKDRWESKDREDDSSWKAMLNELRDTLNSANKLKRIYQHRADQIKDRNKLGRWSRM